MSSETSRGDEASISVGSIVRSVYRYRLRNFILSVVCVAVAVLYLHTATARYTVSLKIAPAAGANGGELRKLGSLARFAGLAGATEAPVNSFEYFLEGLTSREAAAGIAKDEAVMSRIFSREYDSESKSWREPGGVMRSVMNGVKILLGVEVRAWEPPGAARLQNFIEKRLLVSRSRESSVVTLAMVSDDPESFRLFLSKLHRVVDDDLRKTMLRRSNNRIKYINEQLSVVKKMEYRAALTSSLSSEETTKMMASADKSFSARIISGPEVSFRPTSPKPVAVLILTFFLALVLATATSVWSAVRIRR